jgi:hypothetical protein
MNRIGLPEYHPAGALVIGAPAGVAGVYWMAVLKALAPGQMVVSRREFSG